jgi:hypothetical protein
MRPAAMSATERPQIESLGRKFTKLKERDKGLVRLLVAKLAQATSQNATGSLSSIAGGCGSFWLK